MQYFVGLHSKINILVDLFFKMCEHFVHTHTQLYLFHSAIPANKKRTNLQIMYSTLS